MSDEELVSAMAKALLEIHAVPNEVVFMPTRTAIYFAKTCLDVCRPVIQAQERKMCADQADAFHSLQFDTSVSDDYAAGYFAACNDIADALNDMKSDKS